MIAVERFVKRHSLILMLLMQLLWLLGIGLAGATDRTDKVGMLLFFSVMATALVMFLPSRFFSWRPRWDDLLAQNERRVLWGLGTAVFLIGLYYASVQRVWPWDEEHSFQAAQIVARDGAAALLRGYAELPWLGAQHPPLMMLLYGYTMRLFGETLFVMRLVAVLMGVGVMLLTYFIGRDLYDRKTGLAAALFLLSFPLIFRQAAAAMTDIPVTFFFALALWLTLRLVKRPSYRLAFLIAAVIGVGILTKYTMVFIYPVLMASFLFLPSFRQRFRALLVLFLLPSLFLLVWGGVAYTFGILGTQIETIMSYASLIMTSQLVRQFALETFLTRLPSALGAYNIPLIGLGLVSLLRRREEPDRLLLLWIGVVWVLLALTLPDHRYFMLTFPAIAIMIARGCEPMPMERTIMLAVLLGGGTLYLFADWHRASYLFLP